MIRFCTLNLQTGVGTTRGYWHYLLTGWKYFLHHSPKKIEEAGRFFKDHKIDVITLNEVEGGSFRSKNQLELLENITGLHGEFFTTRYLQPFMRQGNAMLSRYPMKKSGKTRLSRGGEPRYLCETEINIKGKKITVLTTHLSVARWIRKRQIPEIAARLKELKGPVILGADFNVQHPEDLDPILETRMKMAPIQKTFPTWNPTKHMDYILHSKHFKVRGVKAKDERISDHLPIIAELEM